MIPPTSSTGRRRCVRSPFDATTPGDVGLREPAVMPAGSGGSGGRTAGTMPDEPDHVAEMLTPQDDGEADLVVQTLGDTDLAPTTVSTGVSSLGAAIEAHDDYLEASRQATTVTPDVVTSLRDPGGISRVDVATTGRGR